MPSGPKLKFGPIHPLSANRQIYIYIYINLKGPVNKKRRKQLGGTLKLDGEKISATVQNGILLFQCTAVKLVSSSYPRFSDCDNDQPWLRLNMGLCLPHRKLEMPKGRYYELSKSKRGGCSCSHLMGHIVRNLSFATPKW